MQIFWYNTAMPELPEVETIVNDLQKILPGLKIRDVWTDNKKYVKNPLSFQKFKEEVVGKKIIGLGRRGKNILINLSGGITILIHQKMTGHLLYGKWKRRGKEWKSEITGPLRDDPQNRFIHFIFFLSNGWQLALCDMRKFAKILLWPTAKLNGLKELKELGPEPFDKKFTLSRFQEILKGKRGKIKAVLMDQKVIAGIGNIYADEILWQAGVHPLKETAKLTEDEIKKIYKAIRPVLRRAIKARGSSYVDYRDAFGRMGRYQEMHYAYQMTGKKCRKNDGGIIKRVKIGGRSAHFCPVHQKL